MMPPTTLPLLVLGLATAPHALHRAACAHRAAVVRMSAAPFKPSGCEAITEPDALWALDRMQQVPIEIDTPELRATVKTTFHRPSPAAAGDAQGDAPVVLFLHGADFSLLEWRFVLPQLCELGIDCAAIDWWSGGWTERAPITQRLQQGGAEPWTL
eukprot:1816894-Prymnesium_polylepis.1